MDLASEGQCNIMIRECNKRPRIFFPPPVLFAFIFGAGYLLQKYYALKIISGYSDIRINISIVLFIAYWIITVPTVAQMIRNNTSFSGHGCTTILLKGGFFRFSRNPLYLSLLIVMASIAFYVNSLWFVFVIPVLLLSLDRLVVVQEERFLEEKFGDDYLLYKKNVRRWL